MKCWNSECDNEALPDIDFCEECREQFVRDTDKYFGGVEELIQTITDLLPEDKRKK